MAALVTGHTVAAAAEIAGVSERTGWRYSGDVSVRQALVDALDQAFADATRQVVTAMTDAVTTLEAIHKDEMAPPASRVSAARAIVTSGPKFYETKDLAERVTALEEAIGG